ncbi:MAG: hypothetical protein ACAI43_05085 [Phycisphaerae bacterium]|nr:hypothetical protein [Tepidisphaeraceae bacterium]
MAVFGGYEVVGELYRHGLGSVSRARSTDGDPDPKYVVKTFQPPLRASAAQDDCKTSVREFLDAVRVQQDVGSGGAKHWAPIYEAGAVGRSGYYVTTHYPRSAQKLIAGRVKLTPVSLQKLIAGAVEGLLELQRTADRAHGNLKPSNLLIDGESEIESAAIHLTDPCPKEQLPAGPAAQQADLAAVGNLICQLVLHRLFKGSQSWPIPDSPEWRRLGAKGKAWRDLCNKLLNPAGAEGFTLETLKAKVHKLRPGRHFVTPMRVVVVLFLLLAGSGTYLGFEFFRHKKAWAELCREYDGWVHRFQSEVKAGPERAQRLKKDPHVGPAIEALLTAGPENLDPKMIAGQPSQSLAALAEQPPLSLAAAGRTRTALAAIRTAEEALSAERWPVLRELAERQKLYKERGWDGVAKYLGELTSAAELQPGRNVAAGIDAILSAQDGLRKDFAEIEERWQTVSATRKLIAAKAAADPMLGKFDALVKRLGNAPTTAPATPPRGNPVEALRAQIVALAEVSGQLDTVLNLDWEARVDAKRLAAEAGVYRNAAAPTVDDFRTWLREVQDFYRYRPDGHAERVKGLQKQLDAATADVATMKKDASAKPETVADLEKRLATSKQALTDFAGKSWVQKDRRTGAVDKGATELQTSLAALVDEAGKKQPPRLIAGLMAAENPAATFKLTVKAEQYTHKVFDKDEELYRITVTPELDCYLTIVVRDAHGDVSLLVPNSAPRMTASPLASGKNEWILDHGRLIVDVKPPYGKTTFKVIGTAQQVQWVGVKVAETGLYSSVEAMSFGGRSATTIGELFKPGEWAVGEATVVTKAPK